MVINSKTVAKTIYASAWNGENSPFTQTISVPEITSETYGVEITPSENASLSQEIAYINAAFCGGNISTGSLTIQALGKKPEVDIPIVVIIRGEI